MNEQERQLRFFDHYIAAAYAALKRRAPESDDVVELYVSVMLEEARQLYRVYRDYEGRQLG